VRSARDATAVFSDYAQDYDAPRRRLIPVFDEFYGVAVECLRLTAGPIRRLLDLGAGTGLMAAAVLSIARQRCLVVLLTDLNPAAIEQGLLPHVHLLSSKHQVLLAAVADPRVAEMAAGRGDAAAVYEAAAAVTAQAGRTHIGALLRRNGVEVVDAPPDRLPPALADAYLSLKAAGRL